jgi:flagellin
LAEKSSIKASTGQEINSAKDDAAGLAASLALKSSARALGAALSNANRGVALGQIVDGALGEIGNMLLRMKELSVQANSDTFSDNDRAAADKEFQALIASIDNVAARTRYSGNVLLDGTMTTDLAVQTGEKSTDMTTFTPVDARSATLFGASLDITTMANAVTAQDAIDTAITALSASRSEIGAFMNGLESMIAVGQVAIEKFEAAIGVFTEADLGKEATNYAASDVQVQLAQSMLAKLNQALSNVMTLFR